MNHKSSDEDAAGEPRRRRKLSAAIKRSLRELRIHLSLLNQQVSGRLELNDVDLDCLDLIASHGPFRVSALARRAALHPATVTGILDRLEHGGWVIRERDPADRRAVVVRALHQRTAEMMRLYAGMNSSMDQLCTRYSEAQLEVINDFLTRAAHAGEAATGELSGT
jgi:DNA-binding MarR family transcriptional regulator